MTPKIRAPRAVADARGCRLGRQSAISTFRVHVHLFIICESVLGVDLPGGPFQLKLQIRLKSARHKWGSAEAQAASGFQYRLWTQPYPPTYTLLHSGSPVSQAIVAAHAGNANLPTTDHYTEGQPTEACTCSPQAGRPRRLLLSYRPNQQPAGIHLLTASVRIDSSSCSVRPTCRKVCRRFLAIWLACACSCRHRWTQRRT